MQCPISVHTDLGEILLNHACHFNDNFMNMHDDGNLYFCLIMMIYNFALPKMPRYIIIKKECDTIIHITFMAICSKQYLETRLPVAYVYAFVFPVYVLQICRDLSLYSEVRL